MYKSKISLILVIILCMNLIAIPTPAYAVEESNPVHVWLTDISTDSWVASQNDVSFQTVQTTNPLTINVDASQKYQEIQGFGAAMTDSSAWLIDKLSTSSKETLMNNLFNTSTGIGISLLRTPMGATDVNASGSYSYDDMPAGETDPTLANFSIQHDEAYIIPTLQQALALNPSIKITATPWSAPGWMKTSGSMIGGTLKYEYYSTFANYFVKFIQAYSNAGIPISYVSPQNEPMGTPTWPGMFLSAYQETKLVQEMGQAFNDNGISTKILVWDHNWDVPTYPEKIYSDSTASNYAFGTAWHIYSGNTTYQTIVHNDYPGKQSFITEATGGIWQADDQKAFYDALNTWIIDGTRNWANGVMLWNIALDPEMGPLNSDTNGIPMMRGLVTIDPDTDEVTYNPDYYALAHASKFVQPGAYRIYSNTFGEGSIEDVAFQNPDGSKVLIVYNSSSESQTFSVADGTESFEYTLKAGNAATFTWTGPTQNGSTPAATNIVDLTHDFTFEAVSGSAIVTSGSAIVTSGSAIITYDPELLQYQNTIGIEDGFLSYSLPVGASIHNTGGTALDRSGWTVTASSNSTGDLADENGAGDAAVNAIDGDLDTRWTNGHGQKNGDWFQIDLGTSSSFDQIVLENGVDSSFDYTNKYQIYVSNDGINWGSALANGSGGIGKIIITLPTTQTAQYIRIVNTAASGFWWSIGEINVYSSSRTDSITAPTSVSNDLQLQNWTSTDGAQVTVVYNGTGSSQDFQVSTDGTVTYTLPGGSSAMFTTKASSSLTPTFDSLTPDEGIAGNKVTINGSNFGDLQGMGTVYSGSIPAYINTWSDSSITVYVPDGLSSGTVNVTVNGSNGVYAGGASFNVKSLPTALDRTGWVASASDVSPWGDVPGKTLDGDSNSRYSSGTGQYDGLTFTVDMGQTQTFNRIMIDSGSGSNDYARSSDIYVSTDGTNWTKVTSITGADPLQLVALPTQTARYIKVVCTGSEGYWWSIVEFNVYNTRTNWIATASDVSPWGDVPGKMLDGNTDTRYSSGTGQYDGLYFSVDMGQTETFNKIVINSGDGSNDYARSSDVYVSNDGAEWTKVSSITGTGPLQEVTFKTQNARYIKVACTGNEGYWWSVAEFDVYETDTEYRANWTATATDVSPWGDVPGKMLDGNRGTRYSSGTGQYNGLSFTVDMGQAETFNKIVIDSGDGSNDYARSSDVYVSTNGTNWTKVSSVTGSGPLQEISFKTQTARYIKIVCTDSVDSWWSVAEFNVYNTRSNWTATATDVSPWGDVPSKMLDGNRGTRYSSGTGQYDGLSFTVDMGQTETFNKIVIDSGDGSNDYARSSDVYVSTDGTDWTKVTSITGIGPLQQVAFQDQTARYIKIVCTGNEGYWWSVAEFEAYKTATEYRTGWTATASDVSPWGDMPANMLDSDTNTRYSSGTGQYDGLSFTVDMGQAETFNKIVIDSGDGSNDYARSSDVYVSTNGTTWTKVSSVTGTGPVQQVGFEAQTARYIKVVCTGNEGYWWSVAEFNVYNNNAPVLAAIGSKSANEGSLLSFTVSASDTDNDTLTYSTNTLPQGATFNTTSGELSWTPDNTQAGTYSVTITVSDGILTDSEDVTIIVNNVDIGSETGSGSTPTPTVTPTATPTATPLPTPTTTPLPTTIPTPVPDKVSIEVEPVVKGDVATAIVDLDVLVNAFKQTKEGANGIKIIQLEVQVAEGVTEYIQEIPKGIFNTGKNQETQKAIEIKTPVGTIVVPDNMFKESDIKKAENVGISIAAADVSSLSKETKAKIGDRPVIELNATVDGKVISWKNNDAAVTISINYTPTATELKNPDSIVIWYIDGKGKVQSVPTGKYDPETGKVTFTTTHFSTYAVAYNYKTFKDAGKYKWAQTPIEMVASKGIMSGTSETMFSPDANITRAQFVDALVKTLGLTAEFDTNFKDIKKTDSYYESVGITKKLGLVVGTGNNKFSPNATITRQEIAVLVVRAMKLAGKTTANGSVKDLKEYSDYSKIVKKSVEAMEILANEGILTGKNNKINPTGKVTRAQTAVIMYRIFNK